MVLVTISIPIPFLTTLRILQKTKSKENSYTYSSAIREVEAYLSNDDIIQAVNEAKKYINVPAKGISIAFASAVNRNDVKAYEKLKNMDCDPSFIR